MNHLCIGVDFDNVINNFTDVMRPYIRKKIGYDSKQDDYDLLPKHFTQKQRADFYNDNIEYMQKNTEPQENVIETISYLMEDHKIYIVTARGYDFATHTVDWLKKYKIPYTDILFQCGNKVDVSKYLNLDIVIEDSPYNLLSLAHNNIKTITFDYPYNRNVYATEYRFNHWVDIGACIMNNLSYSL